VLPVVVALVADPQWRVRERVLEQLPLLADQLGAAVFEERLLSIYLSSYHDQVNAVRLAATRQLQPITTCLGVDWCVAKLVPKLREFYNSGANYQQRITILYAVQVCLPARFLCCFFC
jgi:serine/threonine-protein phosphatase 2A regulatory subunit A